MSKEKEEKVETGTLIDGIAASQHLDSSGERIMIEGIDISSLDKDGVFNFEHDSKQTSSIVGKIIEAKKILKESDCENDRHKYYWNKIKMPYLYVAGELFDAVGHQAAKDVAAMLRYDKTSKKNKETKNLVNFSIEGQRLDKKGSEITKCIARKVSVTITPCNKVCVAEQMESSDIKNSKSIKKFGQHEQNFSFIQDLMNKNEEHFASCEVMQKTNPGEMGMAANIKSEFKPKREFTSQTAPDTIRTGDRISNKPAAPSEFKPRREFNSSSAPDKLKTGDRISYKDAPRAKSGAEIYGKPPKEKASWEKKEKKAKITELEKAEFFSKLRDKIDQFKARRQIDSTAKRLQSERESKGIPFHPDQTVIADKNKTTLSAKMPQRESMFEPIGGTFMNPVPNQKPFYAKDLPKEEADKNRAAIDSAVNSMQNDRERTERIKQAMKQGGLKEDLTTEVIKSQAQEFLKEIKKALSAGSGMGAPSTKVQGDALQSEEIVGNKKKKAKPREIIISKAKEEERAKVFGTKSQPSKSSPMRDKHMNHISNFAEKFFGLRLKPSGGKIDEKTGERRDLDAEVGVDKPDWRSGNLESQWNPEAAVHELAHLILLPEGVGLKDGQKHMDKQYADVQRQYGYMKQKRSQGEVQPMAVEQLLRRAMGLPPSDVAVPVKPGEPPRTSVEDPSVEIATRVERGTSKDGRPKVVDLIRQSKNLTPENRERIHKVLSGQLKFHHEHGWLPSQTVDAKISAKEPFIKSEEEQLLDFIKSSYPHLDEEQQDMIFKAIASKRTEEMVVDLKKKKKKPFHGYNEKRHSKSGGLNDKAREKMNRETGSDLKRPVTGKVKPGSKAAKRRKSFCARMSGTPGPTSKEGKLTPKGAALKRWKC